MAENYLIAIGGTGSRCLEAVIHLAAAGIFRTPINVLIIDPDQNNGNSVKVRTLITDYHALSMAHQPANSERKKQLIRWEALPQPEIFQSSINVRRGSSEQFAFFWHNPNTTHRRFGEVIQYEAQNTEFKKFLDLFYEPNDLEMVLDFGYRGRTSVGAVALKQDLEGTAVVARSGVREFLEKLNIDIQANEARIFVMGSVFGGTGAAGLPTIPQLIGNLSNDVIAHENRQRLVYGCAMMTPYFSFPTGKDTPSGPGTDSARHAIATQAALLHYAHVPPAYQHVYFIGAPDRPQTNASNHVGGEQQVNDPHYAEVVAALAAWQFFSLPTIRPEERRLHFADTVRDKRDLGVTWETLPLNLEAAGQRDTLKRRLTIFTTLTYFYRHFLYDRFIHGNLYRGAAWYKDNFEKLSLDDDLSLLQQLYEYSNSYLQWLAKVCETGERAGLRLFNRVALVETDLARADGHLGNLLDDPMSSTAGRATSGFDNIYARLDSLNLRRTETDSALGLFLYMLNIAVSEFCHDNYSWKRNQ